MSELWYIIFLLLGEGFLFGQLFGRRMELDKARREAWNEGWKAAMSHASTITLNYLKSLKEEAPW